MKHMTSVVVSLQGWSNAALCWLHKVMLLRTFHLIWHLWSKWMKMQYTFHTKVVLSIQHDIWMVWKVKVSRMRTVHWGDDRLNYILGTWYQDSLLLRKSTIHCTARFNKLFNSLINSHKTSHLHQNILISSLWKFQDGEVKISLSSIMCWDLYINKITF